MALTALSQGLADLGGSRCQACSRSEGGEPAVGSEARPGLRQAGEGRAPAKGHSLFSSRGLSLEKVGSVWPDRLIFPK